MADGFDIHMNADLARRLKAAAQTAGVDPADYANQLLDGAVEARFAEDDHFTALTGISPRSA
jgi:hypothetical protein